MNDPIKLLLIAAFLIIWMLPDGGPAPIPPEPVPPSPIDPITNGVAVLIVEETNPLDRQSLTESQKDIILGLPFREWMDSKHIEYRIWDPDSDVSGEAKSWGDVLHSPRQSLPWIYISNGKTGYSGPIKPDDTVESIETLIEKYL